MKRLIAFLVALTCMPLGGARAQAAPQAGEFRAAWVSSAYNLDFPSKKGLTSDQLKAEIEAVLDRAVHIGLNAVVVQVRPSSDALYPSAYYPWSDTLTGTQGTPPPGGFDPLAYWVERGHARGLAVHAWVNPYRVTTANQKITDPAQLSFNHPARQNPSWAIAYKDALYFDPGRPEVRQLTADGVAEIARNYKVDGIHLDDYFYPGTDFPDDFSYGLYGGGLTRDDWRRENVNSLIRLLQKTVKDINPAIRYGISPTAIWQNASSTPLGSDTRGYESYKSSYADTRRWVQEGWLDYICPQIYWHIGFDIADYAKVLAWWTQVCDGANVDLYVGHAAYREEAAEKNWNPGEIVRQLQMNAQSPVVKGAIFFRMNSLRGGLGDQLKAYYAANPAPAVPVTLPAPIPAALPAPAPAPVLSVPAFSPVPAAALLTDKLYVAQPPAGGETVIGDAKGFTILGTAIPGVPLYMNGQTVTNRTAEGFFSVYAPIVKGENRFTFTQEGQAAVTRVVTLKDTPVTLPPVLSALGVSDAYPSSDEMGSPGDKINLRVTAPAGAAVTAALHGATIPLTQDNPGISNHGATVYGALYSGAYTLPAAPASGITDLGRPVYTAVYNGKTYTATAGASVRVIGADAPYRAEVTAPLSWAYNAASTSGGSGWAFQQGQRDRVTAVSGNGKWTRLASGAWVDSADVSKTTAAVPYNALTGGRYIPGGGEDLIVWDAAENAALYADYDGKALTLRFGMQRLAPPHTINPANTLFEHIAVSTENGAPAYVMTLRAGAKLEGFYTDYQDGQLRLRLKKRKALAAGDKPLAGFHIMVDAGHGADMVGALGPMGAAMPEKTLNLTNAQKLAARLTGLGATVTMTRETDVDPTLAERTVVSRRANPDLFISVHANSLDKTTNATNVHGLTMWYRNAASKPLADAFMGSLHNINPHTTRQLSSNQSNFFVCRPSWTPSVIVETSFINNIEDFAWLVNPARQDELAAGIANAVLAYYR